MTHREDLQTRIADALADGECFDKLSDRSYARHDYVMGDHWARRAIQRYTAAENLSIELEALQ